MSRINNRPRVKQYFDIEAATDVLGSSYKSELTTSPFVCTFEFGGTNGYWTGNHAIIQVEDCIDCVREIYADQFGIVLLTSSSLGARFH